MIIELFNKKIISKKSLVGYYYFFIITVFAFIKPAMANTTLYGITVDGKVVEFNKTNGQTSLRLALPSTYTPFESITYCNSAFYASYQGGKLLKFNQLGIITTLLNTGYAAIEALACYQNKVYLSFAESVTSSGNEHNSDMVGYYQESSNSIVPVYDPGIIGPSTNFNIEALATHGSDLYAFTSNSYGTGDNCNGVGVSKLSSMPVLPSTYSSFTLENTYNTIKWVRRVMDGIAISNEVDSSTGFYVTYGVKGMTGSGFDTAATSTKLYRLSNGSGGSCNPPAQPGSTLIGTGSHNGVADLTWGPIWQYSAETAWTPVKMLLD